MLSTHTTRRSLFAIAAASMLAMGCDDDPAAPAPEPAVDRVEFTLTAGATTRTVTVNSAGTQSATANFPAGTTTVSLSARFLKADGSVETLITAADFDVRQVTAGSTAGVTFALTQGQSFQGTISGLTGTGARIVQLQLWHKGDNHADFGPHPLTLQIG